MWKSPSWAIGRSDRSRPSRGLARAASGASRAAAVHESVPPLCRSVFDRDLEWLVAEPLSYFHNYAFATLRQCGAAFELAGAYLRWLEAGGECGLERAAEALRPDCHDRQGPAVQDRARRQQPRVAGRCSHAGRDGRSVGRDDDGADGSVRVLNWLRRQTQSTWRPLERLDPGPRDRWMGVWEIAAVAPGRAQTPADLEGLALDWIACERTDDGGGGAPRRRPLGPRSAARLRRGRLVVSLPFRGFRRTSHSRLRFEGLATVVDVWLNGTHILRSESMFVANAIDVSRHSPRRQRARAPLPRARPAAGRPASAAEVAHRSGRQPTASLAPHHASRTHARLVPAGRAGRARGGQFCSSPLIHFRVEETDVRAELDGDDGVVGVSVLATRVCGESGELRGTLTVGEWSGPSRIASVPRAGRALFKRPSASRTRSAGGRTRMGRSRSIRCGCRSSSTARSSTIDLGRVGLQNP